MLQEKEIRSLKVWCEKLFKATDKDYKTFDLEAEIDLNLNLQENKTILREKLKSLISLNAGNTSIEIIELPKEERNNLIKKYPKEEIKQMELSLIKDLEKKAEVEFNKSLDKISNSKTSDFLEDKYFILKNYAKMVGKGVATALFLMGKQGVGKTFNCIKALQEIKKDFIVISSYLTPLELYNLLYEYKEGYTIIFDDTSMFENKITQSILKSATFSTSNDGVRIVRYLSSTSRLTAPKSFIFKSTIIFCVNSLNKFDVDFKAVLDRCLFYEISFTFKEILKIILEFVKLPYHNLSYEDRNKVFEFIKENYDETCNISLRTFYKLLMFYEYDKENWKKFANEIISPDKDLKLVKDLIKFNPVGACEEYIRLTGKSRATFYRQKKNLEGI